MHAVSANNIGKTYDNDIHALDDFNLAIEPGQVFGLLGPNGAGKTTAVRLLNGTLDPSQGQALIFGNPASSVETRTKTATLAEMAKLYEHLTAAQNLEFFASMYDMDRAAAASRIQTLLERMGLKDREHDKIGTFSTGMKKRVQLARTLLHEPQLIFLDEPTSGLDPDAAKQVTELIQNLAQDEGTTVILCTHNLPVAEKVCDFYGFLSGGKLLASGDKESLIKAVGNQLSIDITTADGTKTIEIESADEINSHVVKTIGTGAKIREVRIHEPDLESLYFEYVGRNTNELA